MIFFWHGVQYSVDYNTGEGNSTPLQYSCWENPMDGRAWQAADHVVAKSWTRLSDFAFTFHFMHCRRKWQPTPVFLPGESQGRGRLVGCRLWGRTESDTTEATQQQQQQTITQLEVLPSCVLKIFFQKLDVFFSEMYFGSNSFKLLLDTHNKLVCDIMVIL